MVVPTDEPTTAAEALARIKKLTDRMTSWQTNGRPARADYEVQVTREERPITEYVVRFDDEGEVVGVERS